MSVKILEKAVKKPELLAPAGSMESVLAAVRCGADAVYAGGERFSARANAANFPDAELEKAVRYCHLHGVKLYHTSPSRQDREITVKIHDAGELMGIPLMDHIIVGSKGYMSFHEEGLL